MYSEKGEGIRTNTKINRIYNEYLKGGYIVLHTQQIPNLAFSGELLAFQIYQLNKVFVFVSNELYTHEP